MRHKAYGVYGTAADAGDAAEHLHNRGITDIIVITGKRPTESFGQTLDQVNAKVHVWNDGWLDSLDADMRSHMELYQPKISRGDTLVMIPEDVVIDSSDAEINATEHGISPNNDYSQTDQGERSTNVHATDKYTDRVPDAPEFGVDQDRRYGVRSEDPERQTRK